MVLEFNGMGPAAAPLPPESEQTPEERAWARALTAYRATELDYLNEQRNKPQTVALALTDSPIGTAAWIVEKLKIWSDSPDPIEPIFTKDQVLTNVMIYLVTNTIGTAIWFYRGNADDAGSPRGKVTVPTGFTSSPHEMTLLNVPESAVARNFNLVRYTKLSRGGHFAFWEQPEAMVQDVRQFFRELRT
jgi:pimeloyl-ACP methyl ester carboxylesterase